MDFELEKIFMQRCLDLAMLGLGNVAPNPMVGSVLVHRNKIIGEGFHRKFGELHAEVNAINSVKNKELLCESSLFVNLEPCSHWGKTPPCADFIIEHKIPKVVIGIIDSFSKVAGKGIEKLRNANIEVKVDILKKESRYLNRRFFTFHEKKRPYIFLKWAKTSDGFIDKLRNNFNISPSQISNSFSKMLTHYHRSVESGIFVGTNTALLDNPHLSVREWKEKNPIRIVLDRNLRLPKTLHLFDNQIFTIVFTEQNFFENEKNLEYIKISFENEKIMLNEILDVLFEKNILSIIVEGGEKLLNTFIRNDFWDEAIVFTSNFCFGQGVNSPMLPENAILKTNLTLNNNFLQIFEKKI